MSKLIRSNGYDRCPNDKSPALAVAIEDWITEQDLERMRASARAAETILKSAAASMHPANTIHCVVSVVADNEGHEAWVTQHLGPQIRRDSVVTALDRTMYEQTGINPTNDEGLLARQFGCLKDGDELRVNNTGDHASAGGMCIEYEEYTGQRLPRVRTNGVNAVVTSSDRPISMPTAADAWE